MKPRNTLVLAALAILLGVALYFLDYRRGEQKQKQEEEAKKILTGANLDKVSEIRLASRDAGGTEVVVRKGGDGAWTIVQPIEAEADSTQVDSIVTELKNLKSEGVASDKAEDAEARKPFGLDAPVSVVTVSFAEGAGSPVTVRVGDKSPVGYKLFVQKEGDPKIYLAGAYFGTTVGKKLADLREKRVFVFERKDLKSISLEYPARRIVLRREGEKWQLVEPIQAPADSSAVDRLVSLLTGLRAQDFEAEDASDLSPYGLSEPQLRVTLDVGEGDAAVKTFLAGGPTQKDKEKLYAKRVEKKPVFTVRASVLKDLTKDPGDLREKKVLSFVRADVQAVEIDRAGTRMRIEKGEGDKWMLTQPEAAEADQASVNQMLITLSGLEAKEFVDAGLPPLAEVGLEPPEISVVLMGKEGAKLAELAIGKEKESGRHWVRNPTVASLHVVDSTFLGDIPKDAEGAKKKEQKPAPEAAPSPGPGGGQEEAGTFSPPIGGDEAEPLSP